MPPSPVANGPGAISELAFARAHPELASLATVQLREAQAFAARLRMQVAEEEERIRELRRWAAAHGVDALPFD